MAKITFLPENQAFPADSGTKILVVARRNKVNIRFGCAACRCGTCAVKILNPAAVELSVMKADEKELLERMNLDTSGDIRLSCQAKIINGDVEVDLAFQSQYSPA